MNKILQFFILTIPFLINGQEVVNKAKNMIIEKKNFNEGELIMRIKG